MSLDDRGRAAARAARRAVDRLPPPPPPRVLRARQRRRSALAAALALAVTVAVGSVVWRNLAVEQPPVGPRPRPVPTPVLPRHAQARIPVGGGPAAVTVAAGAVWVVNQDAGTLSRIDPASNRVVATISGVPTARVRITAGAGAVWVANDTTTARIDPATNRVTATWPVGPGTGGLLASQGALWLSQDDGTVLRVDAATGHQVAHIRVASGVGRMPSALASLDGAVWVNGTGTIPTVSRIDPRTNRPGPPIELGAFAAAGIGWMIAAAGSLWLALDDPGGTVLRIDPAIRRVTARIAVGGRPFGVAGFDAGVFVTDRDAAVVTRIDPATNRVAARIPIPAYGAIAVGADAAWAADAAANTVYRIDPHASG